MSNGRASWPKSLLARINYDMTIRARFGTTVCALVKAELGIAVIDQFTVAHGCFPGVELLRIIESTKFDTYVPVKRGAPLSLYIRTFHPLLVLGNAGKRARLGWAIEKALRVPKK
jgi:DNA-binding transcriptional LysR family regulator